MQEKQELSGGVEVAGEGRTPGTGQEEEQKKGKQDPLKRYKREKKHAKFKKVKNIGFDEYLLT